MAELAYKRVLLKVSGEALMGSQGYGIDMDVVGRIAGEVRDAAVSASKKRDVWIPALGAVAVGLSGQDNDIARRAEGFWLPAEVAS